MLGRRESPGQVDPEPAKPRRSDGDEQRLRRLDASVEIADALIDELRTRERAGLRLPWHRDSVTRSICWIGCRESAAVVSEIAELWTKERCSSQREEGSVPAPLFSAVSALLVLALCGLG